MAFAKFSYEYTMDGTTNIENIYIAEYLPAMDDLINKIYIYGLYLCGVSESPDNTLSALSNRLNVDEATVLDCYTYLQAQGLVQVLNKKPFEVRYLPIKNAAPIRKYSPAKYADFNIQLEELLCDRVISVNEYNMYYDFIETYKFEKEAFLLVVQYAVKQKDTRIGYHYILAVARNWANEGFTTLEKVEQKINDLSLVTGDLSKVFKALGLKRQPDWEDNQLLIKWTRGFEYTLDIITGTAKLCKKGGMDKLDYKLKKYYEAKLFTMPDIKAYEDNKDNLYNTAKAVNKKLGLYYEQLDNIVDTYIAPWMSLGFDTDSLSIIADSCFRRNVRTLDGLNTQVMKFYNEGLVTSSAIYNHFERLSGSDMSVKEILAECGIEAIVTSRMRDFYRTWTYSWNFSHEVIMYCAGLAKSVAQPLPYMNKILSSWKENNLFSIDQIKAQAPQNNGHSRAEQTNKAKQLLTYKLTEEQFASLIDKVEDIEF